jgi:diacylglycerol O-acyltransferase
VTKKSATSATGTRSYVDLPLGVDDPLARLDIVGAETRIRKSQGDAQELYDLFHALGRVHRIGDFARRFAGTAREFSVAISNVPGPPAAVGWRGAGCCTCSHRPSRPGTMRCAFLRSRARAISALDCVDPEAVPNVAGLAAAIESSYTELHSAAIG